VAGERNALDDLLYPSFALGAEGTIAGVTSIYPRVSVDLRGAVQADETERARTIHEATLPLARAVVWATESNFSAASRSRSTSWGASPATRGRRSSPPTGADRQRVVDAVETMREHGVDGVPENR